MKVLSQEVERMRVERAGELESTAQVQAELQQTISASSLLEQRLGQTEAQQEQAKSAAIMAIATNERAIA